jgi:hypothetical protein
MNERRLLVGLGLLVAVLAAVLTIAIVSGSGGSGTATPPLIGAAPTATAPTTPASPVTAPVVRATTSEPLQPTSTTMPVVTMNVPVTASGAVLAPPRTPDTRHEDAPNDCASLVDSGWESIDCKAATSGAGGLTYLIEVLPMPSYVSTRALVFREAPNGAEQLVLQAEDDSGTHYLTGELEAAVVPIPGGTPVIAVGFLKDSGSVLAMDIVEQPGVVAAHRDLPDGAVTASPHGLETWAGPAQPGTGPYTHDTLEDVGGAWRIVTRQLVADDDVPHDTNLLA